MLLWKLMGLSCRGLMYGAAGSGLFLLMGLNHVMELFSRRSLCGIQKCRVGIPSQPQLTPKSQSLSLSVLICRVGLCPRLLSRSLQAVVPEDRVWCTMERVGIVCHLGDSGWSAWLLRLAEV